MLECKYHNRPWISQYQRGTKCECQSCMQSQRDSKICNEVNKNHVTGEWCKKWTQCEKCTQIKFYLRVLRHFAGCGCGRRCEICEWEEKTVEKYRQKLQHIVADLYGLNLGVRMVGWRAVAGREAKKEAYHGM